MQVVVRLSREIPTMEQIFMRNSFVLIVSAIIILRKKGSLFGPAKYQPYLFGRSFFGFLGLITLFYAYSHAAQLSMVGAFIVFRPSFESNPFPLVVAFLSAVTSGVAYTFLSFFKGKVDGLTVMMHFSTFSAIASIPFMLKDFVVPSFKQAVLLLLIGVFGSLGQAFITYAYRFAPASEISIYNYSGIIFSMILGFFILGEPVKFTSVIGGALVAAASVMVYVYNNRSNKKAGDETTK